MLDADPDKTSATGMLDGGGLDAPALAEPVQPMETADALPLVSGSQPGGESVPARPRAVGNESNPFNLLDEVLLALVIGSLPTKDAIVMSTVSARFVRAHAKLTAARSVCHPSFWDTFMLQPSNMPVSLNMHPRHLQLFEPKIMGTHELLFSPHITGLPPMGDGAFCALVAALAVGALPGLSVLCADASDIGDEGVAALAHAGLSGACRDLTHIRLSHNPINEDGVLRLAAAVSAGAFPSLIELAVGGHASDFHGAHSRTPTYSEEAGSQLKAACATRGIYVTLVSAAVRHLRLIQLLHQTSL
jgi:hypothetical protein